MKLKLPKEKRVSLFKNKKFYTILIGLFIIMIMVLSVMDVWTSSEESYVYHGVKFVNTESGWVGYAGNNVVSLPYNPKELENITDLDLSMFGFLEKVYLSTDNPSLSYQSISYFKSKVLLGPTTVLSCLPSASKVSGCDNLPLKDCKSANDKVGVIIFKISDISSSSFVSSSCLSIEGDSEFMKKVIDKTALKSLGV